MKKLATSADQNAKMHLIGRLWLGIGMLLICSIPLWLALYYETEPVWGVLVDGALVERTGKAAVQQWFELMLRQLPGAIPIYRVDNTTQPGVDRTMMQTHLPEGWVRAEIERQIRETAAFCPAVRAVDTFIFTRLRRGLQVEFTAHLHTEETVEVRAYVDSE